MNWRKGRKDKRDERARAAPWGGRNGISDVIFQISKESFENAALVPGAPASFPAACPP